jgi:threonine aldolase
MRQAGVLAAAGIVALEQMVDRLAEDHLHASLLARGLREIQSLSIKPDVVQTNIVYFKLKNDLMSQDELVTRIDNEGVKVLPMGSWLRAVTHYGIEKKDIENSLSIIRRVVEQ